MVITFRTSESVREESIMLNLSRLTILLRSMSERQSVWLVFLFFYLIDDKLFYLIYYVKASNISLDYWQLKIRLTANYVETISLT